MQGKISDGIKEEYSNQYEDNSIIEWRNLGAKYKAMNIIELAESITFDNVLEVGCGEGSILYWLSKREFSNNLNAIEISESGIERTKARNIKNLKNISIFDGYKIPYEDNKFDLIICSHVIEHVEFPRVLLREIRRVSKYQIFEVPIDFSFYVDKKIKHFMSYGHINIFTPGLFRFLLKSENFKIIKDKCYLYDKEILSYNFAGNKKSFIKQRIKNFVLRVFPYLLGIKPNSYAILTEKKDLEISIFAK